MPTVNKNETEYINLGSNQDNERKASTEITKWWQRDFEDVLVE